ncbi:MAG: hypothetical protein HKN12_07875 [Gemmatimonadetes bacterium]|nr:hypothetical protein [Gemmatimonadota bacterium]
MPQRNKLDYGLLTLRARTLERHAVEVIVNETTGRTAWVDRHAVAYESWPDALLGAFSVEPLHPEDNPLRLKPLPHASVVTGLVEPYHPVAVRGAWVRIRARNAADGESTAWLRWRRDEELLVALSPLS